LLGFFYGNSVLIKGFLRILFQLEILLLIFPFNVFWLWIERMLLRFR